MSKSGTLTYQMMYELRDIGFSSAVGIGGDPIIGTTHIDALQAFSHDPDTDAIVMIGEIGGDAEERAAEFISDNVDKPVVGYASPGSLLRRARPWAMPAPSSLAHRAPPRPRKRRWKAGVKVGKTPSETAQLMRDVMTEPAAGTGSWSSYSVDLSGALSGANGDRAPLIVAQIQPLGAQEGVDHLGPAATAPARYFRAIALPSA